MTTISKVSYTPNIKDSLEPSKLTLLFKGPLATPAVINTFRRIALEHIPTYTFNPENIKITNNKTIFDNDYMRLRLSQLIYPNIKNPIYTLDEKHTPLIIELYINVSNTTNSNINITTNDVEFFIDGERQTPFSKKYPFLLIQLRPGDEFKAHCKAELGIAYNVSDIFSSTRNSYYDVIKDDEILFSIESIGQYDEFDIMIKSCLIIKSKLLPIKKLLSDDSDTKELKLVLDNQDHTIGNIINYYLQINKNVKFSGLSKPDLLLQQVVIKIIATTPVIKIINNTIDKIIDDITDLEKQLLILAKNS